MVELEQVAEVVRRGVRERIAFRQAREGPYLDVGRAYINVT